jgi:hypothetical protein
MLAIRYDILNKQVKYNNDKENQINWINSNWNVHYT